MRGKAILALIFAASVSYGGWAELWGSLVPRVTPSTGPTAEANLSAWWTYASADAKSIPDMTGKGNWLTNYLAYTFPTVTDGYSVWQLSPFTIAKTETTSLLNGSSNYSWCVWLYPTAAADGDVLTYAANSRLTYQANKKLGVTTQYTTKLDTMATLETNTWVHVAVVYHYANPLDPPYAGTHIYINGAFDSQIRGSEGALSIADVWFMGTYYNTYVGRMDDFRFYNKNLSSNEVVQVYNEGRK